MKLLLRSSFAFVLLFCWLGPKAFAVKGAQVPVELEWEIVPGAKLYELEFQNLEGKRLAAFKSANHVFKFKFKIGRYKVRSRVADTRNVYGEWSVLTEFTVQPPPPGMVSQKSKAVVTKGVVDPKTMKSEVTFHWAEAVGANRFRVKVIDQNEQVILNEIVKGFSYTTHLKAGIYTTVLSSISEEGIESEPITLPGRVVIEAVQLEKPVIAFEEVEDIGNPKVKIQRLPMAKNGAPILRWKQAPGVADTVGTLEYRYFFGEEWIPVDKFTSKNAQEIILEKALKPGRYRINAWAELEGSKKSEATSYEFVVKPKEY